MYLVIKVMVSVHRKLVSRTLLTRIDLMRTNMAETKLHRALTIRLVTLLNQNVRLTHSRLTRLVTGAAQSRSHQT